MTGLPSRADHGVSFVDEEDDRNRRSLHLGDHLLETVLKLPLHSRPGLKQPHIERSEHDILENLGNVSLSDPKRQSLDDGRLADSRLAGQDGIVLPATDQDVNHLPDFRFTADHRVDLAALGALGKVDGELIERRGLRHRARCRSRRAGGLSDGRRGRGAFVLHRTGDQPHEVGLKKLDLDLGEFLRCVPREPPEFLVVEHRQKKEPRADLSRLILERGIEPGVADELIDLQGQGRRALIARTERVDHAGQVAREGRGIDLEVAKDAGQVGVGCFDEFENPVLDLDRGIGPRETKARRRLQGVDTGLVERLDESAGINGHRITSPGCRADSESSNEARMNEQTSLPGT